MDHSVPTKVSLKMSLLLPSRLYLKIRAYLKCWKKIRGLVLIFSGCVYLLLSVECKGKALFKWFAWHTIKSVYFVAVTFKFFGFILKERKQQLL